MSARRLVGLAALLALGTGALTGCTKATPTQIVVAVAVDPSLKIPEAIDSLVIEVRQEGKTTRSRTLDLTRSPTLPATLAINPGSDLASPVTVAAEVSQGSQRVVRREARLRFVVGRAKLLRLELVRACAFGAPVCQEGATCVSGACVPVEVDATTLPDWSEAEAYRPIPASDATIPDLRRRDRSPVDRGRDVGADHGTYPEVPGVWVKVSKGTFTMGAPFTEATCSPDMWTWTKETQHPVTLTHDFEMAATEMTVSDLRRLFGKGASSGCAGDRCPATGLTWHDAAATCNKLSEKMGLAPCFDCQGTVGEESFYCQFRNEYLAAPYACRGYRLPTEAEWEYAYRAGTQTAFYSGPLELEPCVPSDAGLPGCQVSANADAIGWYCANGADAAEVARKRPNSWGFYDMAGNATEWVLDVWKSDLGAAPAIDPVNLVNINAVAHSGVFRGGNFRARADRLRAAARQSRGASIREEVIDRFGVRCLRVLP